MTGMTSPPSDRSVREQLAALLAAVDRGEVEATSTERAYLAGALDIAERLDAAGPGPRS